MKRLLTTTVLLLLAIVSIQAEEVSQLVNVLGRQITSLNGEWNYTSRSH